MTLERISADEEQTRDLGATLGAALRTGDIVLLSGELGTGKTCLTQGIGRGLGWAGVVNSPSFVIMNEYHGRETLFHCDLYRMEDVEELDELGLWDYAERGVLVIEWPDGESRPTKFTLTTLPRRMSKKQIARIIKERWRTERAYEELKGELGLDHYEGRSFPGWNHHVSVVLCCYAFVVGERMRSFPPSARWVRPARSVNRAA